jgi:hypothetical protein
VRPKRTNILDALAQVAASSPDTLSPGALSRDDAGRGHVLPDHVAADHVARDLTPVRVVHHHVTRDPVARDHVAPGSRGTDSSGYRTRIRREKPHVSLYAHPRVLDAIRDLAQSQRRKPHDLYIDGLRLVLKQHGIDYDALDRS